ncbi:MAG: ribonuclease P protein component [Rhodospirillales bacterium]
MTEARIGRQPTRQLKTLLRRADFLRVAAARRRSVTPGFILQAAIQPEDIAEHAPRVGYTASRKVGNAVIRNRAKRRLRAIVRELMPSLAKDGTDYVLIARQETPARDFALLQDDLRHALQRVEPRRQRAAS